MPCKWAPSNGDWSRAVCLGSCLETHLAALIGQELPKAYREQQPGHSPRCYDAVLAIERGTETKIPIQARAHAGIVNDGN